MDKLFGLPAHPFLVHIPIVLLPLAAIGVVIMAINPGWYLRYRWAVLAIGFAGMLGAVLAASAGEDLEHRIIAVEGRAAASSWAHHADLGDTARLTAVLFFVVLSAYVLIPWWRQRGHMEATIEPQPRTSHRSGRLWDVSQAAFDFEDLDDGGEPTYSVGELADAVNGALRRQFGDGVWVRGEIQGYSEKNGHAYFKLVESGDDRRAVLDVSFFANVRMKLRPLLQRHRLLLAEGMKVRVFGVLDYYAANGRLSLKMGGIDPRYTLGEMAMQRDDVVRRLVASGLYDANRRRAMPAVPLRVGLVTSVNSAAWHDFMHQLKASGHGFGVRVIDVRVQGDLAEEMLTTAIRSLGRRTDIDVLVVIRGGGSRTELAMFDSESIATAIAGAGVPVFTGLGHEIDRSVADEVAHTALKTPTACAVALIDAVQAFATRAETAWSEISARSTRHIERSNRGLLETARRIEQRTVGAVERAGQRLTDRAHRVSLSSVRVLDHADAGLDRAAGRVGQRPLQHAAQQLRAIDQIEARIRLLDPVHTLARGWSLTRTAEGRIVRSAADVGPGDEIVTTFADGTVTSRITSISSEETPPP